MQRDRDDVLAADAACKFVRDEDVPLSRARIVYVNVYTGE
jgi:hypothetical protein